MLTHHLSEPQRHWRLRPGQRLLHCEWEDEFVVFNDLTGDSHLLDAGGFAILECLQQDGSATVLSLASQFDDIDPNDPVAIEQFGALLASLAHCELIELVQ